MHKSFAFKASMASKVMHQGGVIAYPTEAVWGVGCDPFNEKAVERLLWLKQRPVEKGLILISGQKAHFESLLSPFEQNVRERFFEETERPTTWLVPDVLDQIPVWIKGAHESVALRYTKHDLCSELSKCFGGLIVSTSANPASSPSATTLYQIRRYFSDRLDFCAQGKLGGSGKASQIKDLFTGKTLRA